MNMNTGYLIEKYKNTNVYSSTYGSFQTERFLNLDDCPIGDYALIIEIEIPENNYIWESRFYANSTAYEQYYSYLIDWGDGSISKMQVGTRSTHTYAQAGTYQVSYYAPIAGRRGSITSSHDKLIKKVIAWGKSMEIFGHNYEIFKDCDLHEIVPFPENFFNNYIYTWEGTSINNLNFKGMFENNINLINIPENLNIYISYLLSNNEIFLFFTNMFKNTGITEIPSGFINLNTTNRFNSIYLDSVFENCSSLTNVNNDAFKGLDKIGNSVFLLSSCFKNCNLNTFPVFCNDLRIPENVNDKYDLYFNNTFENNINMTGTANLFNIYDSAVFRELNTFECFKNCTALSNYDEIPSNWK